ncbi:short chain dehydrogenase [Marinobacter lipolyticus SM19]|uniref:Short chain dehydrogenase n=1 Tax=Marinobacter lipolyticus SM19 TaxID=1318628 RepID=R8B678_9GAMM|nr:SDR family oxidoreductase [Marinobacter lipolyticus]EON94071.1 short chain dehydrogenase [Marinobacter lipolyticus SM19]
MQLRNRRFLLLGGTGGIGQSLLQALLAEGVVLLVASRQPESLQLPEGASGVKLDLAAEDLDQQLQAITDTWSDIYGVIHCAGQNQFAGLSRTPVSAIDGQLAVNLRSPMLVARHFAPRFAAAGEGALVFVGSTFGSIGFPGYTAYCATKFGLRGFTEALRRELADSSVQVVYVAPRATATAMNPQVVNQLNQALGNAVDSPEMVAQRIVKAMTRDQRRCFMGWPERLFVVINGVLPRLVDRALFKQLPVIRRFLESGVSQ